MKRDKHLRDLSSEHHQALVLVRKIENACKANEIDARLINEVRAVFQTELALHFQIEEEAILPALEALGEMDLVDKTLDDHRRLRELNAQLDEPGALRTFSQALKEHVQFEERILFEICQKLLDGPALAAVAAHAKSITQPPTLH